MRYRILCFGDSNTYGYDPRFYLGGRYPKSVRWTGWLEAEGWEVLNAGKNGRSIPQLDFEIEAAARSVQKLQPDILTVMLGSNDLLLRPGLAAEVCGERMERFLTVFSGKVSLILQIAPPPIELGAWVTGKRLLTESRRLAGRYQELAHRLNIHFADAGTWNIELVYDGVHFSEKGHQAFADHLLKILTVMFASTK